MTDKGASTDYPVHELVATRWSPYAFQDRPVSEGDLRSLFEAARWAPSSFNEQPWSYIVATKDHPEQFRHLLSCLVEFNQVWAKTAPVLALGIVRLQFARDGTLNRASVHDLGLAAGNLLLEATARGLFVHQMLGIFPDKAREIFAIPEGNEAWTAMAIGYRGALTTLPEALKERDLQPRQRKPLSQFVFGGKWGKPKSCLRVARFHHCWARRAGPSLCYSPRRPSGIVTGLERQASPYRHLGGDQDTKALTGGR